MSEVVSRFAYRFQLDVRDQDLQDRDIAAALRAASEDAREAALGERLPVESATIETEGAFVGGGTLIVVLVIAFAKGVAEALGKKTGERFLELLQARLRKANLVPGKPSEAEPLPPIKPGGTS